MSPLTALLDSLHDHQAELRAAPQDAVRFTDLVYRSLADSDLFKQTIQQLTSRDVKDAACDNATALRHKAEGDAASCRGDPLGAACSYSKALRYLDATSAAGRRHAVQMHNTASRCLMEFPHSDRNTLIALSHARQAARLDGPKGGFWEAKANTADGFARWQAREMPLPSLAALLTSRAPAVEVQERAGAGRTLVAKDAISAGSTALFDLPFETAPHKRHRQQLCSQCTAPLQPVPLPCGMCPLVTFCSDDCREASAHQPGGCECGVPWTLLLPQDALLANRAARRLASSDDGLSAHMASLESHLQALPFEQRLELAVLAVVTASCSQDPPASAVVRLAAATLTAVCQVAVNGVAIVPPVVRTPADRRALALYPLASLLNHSCCPNVSMSFEDSRLVVRALRDLPPGTELLHCYGPQAGEHITPLRRQLLQQQYHFQCACDACRQGDADAAAEAAQVGVRCGDSSCGGAVVLPCEVAQLTSLHSVPEGWLTEQCTRCNQELPRRRRTATLSQLQRAQALFSRASDASDGGEAAAALHECMRIRRAQLHPRNELLGATADAFADVTAASGKFAEAAQHCQASLDIMSQSYPANSTAVAHGKLKLAALLHHLQRDKQEAQLVQEAVAVLQLHHGQTAATQIIQTHQTLCVP